MGMEQNTTTQDVATEVRCTKCGAEAGENCTRENSRGQVVARKSVCQQRRNDWSDSRDDRSDWTRTGEGRWSGV